jgi:hypothetical protein
VVAIPTTNKLVAVIDDEPDCVGVEVRALLGANDGRLVGLFDGVLVVLTH